jgi:hypothetical protein
MEWMETLTTNYFTKLSFVGAPDESAYVGFIDLGPVHGTHALARLDVFIDARSTEHVVTAEDHLFMVIAEAALDLVFELL